MTLRRSLDHFRTEIARYIVATRRRVEADGAGTTARYACETLAAHVRYPLTRRRRAARRFSIFGESLPYEIARFNHCWLNERSVEIAVAKRFLESQPTGRLLEVGNVLYHYGIRGQDVLDRYERVRGVLNEDVVTFRPSDAYDTIISVSTLEHVRFDEDEQDPDGALKAADALRAALRPGGRLFVTCELGYNPGLDAAIRDGRFVFGQQAFLKRVSVDNDWEEVDRDEALVAARERVFRNGNAIIVGVDRAPASDG